MKRIKQIMLALTATAMAYTPTAAQEERDAEYCVDVEWLRELPRNEECEDPRGRQDVVLYRFDNSCSFDVQVTWRITEDGLHRDNLLSATSFLGGDRNVTVPANGSYRSEAHCPYGPTFITWCSYLNDKELAGCERWDGELPMHIWEPIIDGEPRSRNPPGREYWERSSYAPILSW